MGLQKSLTLSSGITLPEAYIRIDSLVMDIGQSVEINVNIYRDKQSCADGKEPVLSLPHICDDYYSLFTLDIMNIQNVNVLAIAYYFLKNRTRFYYGAIDVLDIKEEAVDITVVETEAALD